MTFVSFAQNFEDVLLWRALKDVRDGRYIDIGAQHPDIDSVSHAFYDAGWRGVHAEPVPEFAARLREARPDEVVIEALVSDLPGPAPFYELGGLSSGRAEIAERHKRSGYEPREMMVATVPLRGIFETIAGDIHWLKIDVEGMELEVLRSWGDSPARPWITIIESTAPNSEEQTQHLWVEEILKRGYDEVLFDGLNRYFVHESQPHLRERLNRPANVFDQFSVTARHFSATRLAAELYEASQSAAQERARVQDLENDLQRAEAERESARYEQEEAAKLLARAEQEHRAAIEALRSDLRNSEQEFARETRRAEHQLRREAHETEERIRQEAEEIEARLREQLRNAEAEASAALIECARLQERSLHLDQRVRETVASLRTSEERLAVANESLRDLEAAVRDRGVELERAATESSSALAAMERDRDDLRRQLEAAQTEVATLHSNLNSAVSLIRRAAAEPSSVWQRIGRQLGVARPSSAREAMCRWIEATGNRGQLHGNSVGEIGQDMQSLEVGAKRSQYLRADSLEQLLSWDGVDFVRCAYVTLLGRQPDPSGEAYYLNRLRSGHSKMELLWQLRHSREAASHDPGIAGFDRALRADRRRTFLSRTVGRRRTNISEGATPQQAESVPSHDNFDRIGELAQDTEALASEIENLKAVVDGLAHAVRGMANAQARQEQQLRKIQSPSATRRRKAASAVQK